MLHNMRPVLSEANKHMWDQELLLWWEMFEWMLIDELSPSADAVYVEPLSLSPKQHGSLLIKLRTVSFNYPGPCGISTHTIKVGVSDEFSTVLWHPSRHLFSEYDPSDIATLVQHQQQLREASGFEGTGGGGEDDPLVSPA